MMWQGSGSYVQNLKSICQKIKKIHFWASFFGGQYQILTDPRNGLKNLCTHFGNDRSHRLGGV